MVRPVEDLASRFERQVDRTGEHHVWLGGVNPARGTGRIKVGNAATTAQRVAWELAHGALEPTQRVLMPIESGMCARRSSSGRILRLRCSDTSTTSAQRNRIHAPGAPRKMGAPGQPGPLGQWALSFVHLNGLREKQDCLRSTSKLVSSISFETSASSSLDARRWLVYPPNSMCTRASRTGWDVVAPETDVTKRAMSDRVRRLQSV
jgi:hypothetical protein